MRLLCLKLPPHEESYAVRAFSIYGIFSRGAAPPTAYVGSEGPEADMAVPMSPHVDSPGTHAAQGLTSPSTGATYGADALKTSPLAPPSSSFGGKMVRDQGAGRMSVDERMRILLRQVSGRAMSGIDTELARERAAGLIDGTGLRRGGRSSRGSRSEAHRLARANTLELTAPLSPLRRAREQRGWGEEAPAEEGTWREDGAATDSALSERVVGQEVEELRAATAASQREVVHLRAAVRAASEEVLQLRAALADASLETGRGRIAGPSAAVTARSIGPSTGPSTAPSPDRAASSDLSAARPVCRRVQLGAADLASPERGPAAARSPGRVGSSRQAHRVSVGDRPAGGRPSRRAAECPPAATEPVSPIAAPSEASAAATARGAGVSVCGCALPDEGWDVEEGGSSSTRPLSRRASAPGRTLFLRDVATSLLQHVPPSLSGPGGGAYGVPARPSHIYLDAPPDDPPTHDLPPTPHARAPMPPPVLPPSPIGRPPPPPRVSRAALCDSAASTADPPTSDLPPPPLGLKESPAPAAPLVPPLTLPQRPAWTHLPSEKDEAPLPPVDLKWTPAPVLAASPASPPAACGPAASRIPPHLTSSAAAAAVEEVKLQWGSLHRRGIAAQEGAAVEASVSSPTGGDSPVETPGVEPPGVETPGVEPSGVETPGATVGRSDMAEGAVGDKDVAGGAGDGGGEANREGAAAGGKPPQRYADIWMHEIAQIGDLDPGELNAMGWEGGRPVESSAGATSPDACAIPRLKLHQIEAGRKKRSSNPRDHREQPSAKTAPCAQPSPSRSPARSNSSSRSSRSGRSPNRPDSHQGRVLAAPERPARQGSASRVSL